MKLNAWDDHAELTVTTLVAITSVRQDAAGVTPFFSRLTRCGTVVNATDLVNAPNPAPNTS